MILVLLKDHEDTCRGEVSELEKGKAGIVVRSKNEPPKVVDFIIEAVTKGELDDLLASLARSRLRVEQGRRHTHDTVWSDQKVKEDRRFVRG